MNKQKTVVTDGVTIKYHADGKSIFAKGKTKDGKPDGYWEWFRLDGKIKRSGYFENGEPVGTWVTYKDGAKYKVTQRG